MPKKTAGTIGGLKREVIAFTCLEVLARHPCPAIAIEGVGYGSTWAMPICVSSVRLSSICQLSEIRPFSTFTRSVAMRPN